MDIEHVKLFDIVSMFKGRARAVPRHQILFRMRDIHEFRTMRDSELRILKEQLIEQYGKPVGSSAAGWYLCVDDADFDACLSMYQTKVNDMHRKIAALKKIRERQIGQPELPLGGKV